MTKHPHSHSSSKNSSAPADLLDANEDMAGGARNRLMSVLDNARQFAVNVRDKTMAGAKTTDKTVHAHPYKSIGVAVGIGTLLGFIMGRRLSHKKLIDQD
jgi:ElaB/YqjD/DUF883 family membrane-anchored ribosome-binding protein